MPRENELLAEAIAAFVTLPPLDAVGSVPLDAASIADADDDEWLGLSPDGWSAKHLLQAEQVVRFLRDEGWSASGCSLLLEGNAAIK